MTDYRQIIQQVADTYQQRIAACSTQADLQLLKTTWLGKKGQISSILRALGSMPIEDRVVVAQQVQKLVGELEVALKQQERSIIQALEETAPPIDLSTPVKKAFAKGHIHPTQRILSDIYDIFLRLGFAVVDGPEIETDWYNFEALNMPADHPAREMQDTFYIEAAPGQPALVPRTHTSAAQIRYMQTHEPPFQVIVPGKVYRNENEDRTHSWSFFQVEGLVVGESISVADLKGILLHTMQSLLGEDIKIRLRPSYFPYTEPSFEIDVWYREEWLEICGAGMVHPDVLKRGGVDPEKWSGFAFGFGSDRLGVIRYGLTDLRKLWRPNFLESEQL